MRHGRHRFIVGSLAIPVILYLVFVISPYVQAFQIPLTDWRGVSVRANYIGLDNFTQIFHDDLFFKALRNHGAMLVVVPLATIGLALAFAFLLTAAGTKPGSGKGLGGSGFYRVVFFFPQVLSIAVVGVLFQAVYRPDGSGVLNAALHSVGIGPVGFLTDPSYALWSLMGVMVWGGVGFYLVLFCAGMAAIPKELYEAAQLDGAGRTPAHLLQHHAAPASQHRSGRLDLPGHRNTRRIRPRTGLVGQQRRPRRLDHSGRPAGMAERLQLLQVRLRLRPRRRALLHRHDDHCPDPALHPP
ncbi:carbohydrate ABC transporter permease [Streptomyces sp. NPDC048156]|uniref:carbohydrate ABC transporter permease n=1 Tax=Streptomyces sp. NPDC048156 TaxID=3365502 RepID=UPI0037202984